MQFIIDHVTFSDREVQVSHEIQFDVDPKTAWTMCEDFTDLLKVKLEHQGVPPNPKYIKGQAGEVGAVVEVTMVREGSTNVCQFEVTKIQRGEPGGIYILEWLMLSAVPKLPLKDFLTEWRLSPLPNGNTHLRWTRHFKAPYALGFYPLENSMKQSFIQTAYPIMVNCADFYRQRFPKRLPKKEDKILIVGAGPSGLHMAHLLKKNGHKNITIMEKSDRYGGKSVSVPGPEGLNYVHELGTCYLHPAYYAVRALFKELDEMGGGDFPEVTPEGYSIMRNGRSEVSLDDWAIEFSEIQPKWSIWNLFRITVPKVDFFAEVKLAQLKYNRLHNEIFGNFSFTMPPPLRTETLRLLEISFLDFLTENDLTALLPILSYAQTCQGYGTIERTPAFWSLCWITPELLTQYFSIKPDYPRKAMLRRGWLSLWDAIVRVHSLNIQLNTEISEIKRIPQKDGSTKIVVKGTRNDGKNFEENYDYLVMAIPPVDLEKEENEDSILDLTDEERATFKTNVEAGQFRTVLFQTHLPQPYLKNHLVIYPEKIIGPDAGHGEVFAMRDSYLAMHPDISLSKEKHMDDPQRFEPRQQMCYQYVENGLNLSDQELERKFHSWADLFFGASNFQVMRQKTWEYFRRFNQRGVSNRDPWRVLSFQGKNKTLFVHASTFFESVLDIVNYNNMMLESYKGNFNKDPNYVPVTDARKPANPAKDSLLRFITPLVTPFINLAWAATYAFLLPLNYLVLFPLQRWNLQKNFRTADIGPWYTSFFRFSLSYFINISPSVRCMKDGKEDPIVTKTFESADMDKFPGIQRPQTALSWNYQDYRVMIAEWQRLISPTNLSFITPAISKIISSLRLRFPFAYNYIFSYIAAANFAQLTGFSYRVEDSQGGGLYVPKCRMLAQARKDHGEEIGTRICTHICKVFTEEHMRTKGLDCTFEPNLKTGSCMIRGATPRVNCCSDNSLYQW